MKYNVGAKFVCSAHSEKGFPQIKDDRGETMSEVVVIGRSNVGKSSLLNHLFGAKGLVKTSSTPGKTQLINFFRVDELVFVDVPGFGYSKASVKKQEGFQKMMDSYFSLRDELKLVLYLFDIRRDPKEEDLEILRWLQDEKHQVALVFTKADKVAKTKRSARKKALATQFGEEVDKILYSTTANIGRDLLWHHIKERV